MVWSAADLRNLLTDHGITTVLIGAHADNRYRLEVRHTVDVDFLVSSPPSSTFSSSRPSTNKVP